MRCLSQGEEILEHTWSYRVDKGQCLNCGKRHPDNCKHEFDNFFMDKSHCGKCQEFY